MRAKPPLVYFETTTILALLKGEQGRVEVCKAAFHAAQGGEIRAVTSALTIAEIIKLPEGGYLPPDVEDKIESFFKHEWLTVVQVDRTIASRARAVAWNYSLKPLDAIHVATAMYSQAQRLYTYDDRILAVATKITGLSISEPSAQLLLNHI